MPRDAPDHAPSGPHHDAAPHPVHHRQQARRTPQLL